MASERAALSAAQTTLAAAKMEAKGLAHSLRVMSDAAVAAGVGIGSAAQDRASGDKSEFAVPAQVVQEEVRLRTATALTGLYT